ncbi:unnamed protein product [Eruca vesicaria subsp. sativa]|uniref:Uncharacterized protein n=1 Tax=Eruca vesicaria subsp. sativa TaxID=29727 RepID=A0ABC8KKE4_ERUVS|nr:unnamed protein product [Eruca vesicaria subsp. sativa]
MSRRISDDTLPSIFNRENVRNFRGENIPEGEFVADPVDAIQAEEYWIPMCTRRIPHLEPWIPTRPTAKRTRGRPSRCTFPFLDTVRSWTGLRLLRRVSLCLGGCGEYEFSILFLRYLKT